VLPVDERGSGEPVLLLHAGVADRTMWAEHLDRLADAGFRAVAVDLPGFGEARIAPGRQAPWEDVLETLPALGIDRASLVGDSFGAAVALRVAAVAPAAVRSLMLVSPPPLGSEPSAELQAAWEAEEAALARGDLDAAVAAVLDAWLLPDAPAALRERVAAMQRRAFVLQQAATEVEEAPDPLERDPDALSRLTAAVLTLAGDGDMPDFKHGARQIAAAVPDGQSEILAGAGHLAPLETPDAFWAALRSHLARVVASPR
jgi:pimeloyl-ACP methyl ester carboxylesterase